MKAREIIAYQIAPDHPQFADDILQVLTAAGYRILAPGELDAETAERCAQVAADFADSEEVNALAGTAESRGVYSHGWLKDALHSHGSEIAEKVAASIRSLPKGGDE